MRALSLIVLLALAACTSTVRLGDVPQCAELVEASGLLAPTPPPELPEGLTIGDWQVGFVSAVGALDKANLEKAGAGRLLSKCEDLHRQGLKRATRSRFLGV